MLCIICDKEFSAEQKAEELYSHAEVEHGLSREDYDKVDNYVLEEGEDGGGKKERDAPPPRPATTVTGTQFNRKNFVLKNRLSFFSLRFSTQRNCSKMGSLCIS